MMAIKVIYHKSDFGITNMKNIYSSLDLFKNIIFFFTFSYANVTNFCSKDINSMLCKTFWSFNCDFIDICTILRAKRKFNFLDRFFERLTFFSFFFFFDSCFNYVFVRCNWVLKWANWAIEGYGNLPIFSFSFSIVQNCTGFRGHRKVFLFIPVDFS